MGSDTYHVDVSDGEKFFSGYVTNLSRFGLCLEDLPNKINRDARHLSLVISAGGTNFKMKARTCWAKETRFNTMLGVEIVNALFGWPEFVMSREPVAEEHWAEIEI
jgi:hypothetical protein